MSTSPFVQNEKKDSKESSKFEKILRNYFNYKKKESDPSPESGSTLEGTKEAFLGELESLNFDPNSVFSSSYEKLKHKLSKPSLNFISPIYDYYNVNLFDIPKSSTSSKANSVTYSNLTFRILQNCPENFPEMNIGGENLTNFPSPQINHPSSSHSNKQNLEKKENKENKKKKENKESKENKKNEENEIKNFCELITIKNIFTTQLPRMPKEYITGTVFDPYHKIFGMWKDEKLIGGIAYRPFYTQNLAEIVFCAVQACDQVKGYGSTLMNEFKEHVKSENLHFLLTYADNFAIGFFKKQGFNAQNKLPKVQWHNFIKNYDGSTLMECILYDFIDYREIKKKITEWSQEKMLDSFAEFSIEDIENFKDYEDSESLESKGIKEEYFKKFDDFILNLAKKNSKNLGGSEEVMLENLKLSMEGESVLVKEEMKILSAKLAGLLKRITESSNVWPFLKPIDPKQVSDYYQHIHNPMDISKIKSKFENGDYKKLEDFEDDMNLIYSNCMKYNDKESKYTKAAERLKYEVNGWIKKAFEVESS